MFPKHLVGIRVRKNWKGKVYSFLVPMKGKITIGPGYFYCPYVPKF
jgi:hypothetical protein